MESKLRIAIINADRCKP